MIGALYMSPYLISKRWDYQLPLHKNIKKLRKNRQLVQPDMTEKEI